MADINTNRIEFSSQNLIYQIVDGNVSITGKSGEEQIVTGTTVTAANAGSDYGGVAAAYAPSSTGSVTVYGGITFDGNSAFRGGVFFNRLN